MNFTLSLIGSLCLASASMAGEPEFFIEVEDGSSIVSMTNEDLIFTVHDYCDELNFSHVDNSEIGLDGFIVLNDGVIYNNTDDNMYISIIGDVKVTSIVLAPKVAIATTSYIESNFTLSSENGEPRITHKKGCKCYCNTGNAVTSKYMYISCPGHAVPSDNNMELPSENSPILSAACKCSDAHGDTCEVIDRLGGPHTGSVETCMEGYYRVDSF